MSAQPARPARRSPLATAVACGLLGMLSAVGLTSIGHPVFASARDLLLQTGLGALFGAAVGWLVQVLWNRRAARRG